MAERGEGHGQADPVDYDRTHTLVDRSRDQRGNGRIDRLISALGLFRAQSSGAASLPGLPSGNAAMAR
jgi:hypothetical protein